LLKFRTTAISLGLMLAIVQHGSGTKGKSN